MSAHPETALHDLSEDEVVFAVDSFLTDTALRLHAMRDALARADLRFLARAARRLKRGSREVNAEKMTSLARELLHLANSLERLARRSGVVPEGAERDLLRLLDRLFVEFEKAAPDLAGYVYSRVTEPRAARSANGLETLMNLLRGVDTSRA